MKVNSDRSLEAARSTFRRFNGSWTLARKGATRNSDGVLVIPRDARPPAKPAD